MDEDQIYAELDRVRDDYRALLDSATVAELRQPTDGTKWNNEQLLFHMLFGYLLVRNLRLHRLGVLPPPGQRFQAIRRRCSTRVPARSTSSTTSARSSAPACWATRACSG